MREELSDENIISKDDDSLSEGGVVMVQGRGDDPVIEDRVSQDIDEEDFSLGDGKVEEMGGDLVGRGVQDQGHNEMEGTCFMEHLISSTSRSSPLCYQTASTCHSNQGQCSATPRR